MGNRLQGNNFKHGLNKKGKVHPVYRAWSGMKTRCSNAKIACYKDYGGRGITVCDRWQIFENFHEDMFSTWFEGSQLDRTDVNGNYEPSNCRWVTVAENAKNKRKKAKIQSKYPGVVWEPRNSLWNARINLGLYKTEEEASEMYLQFRDFLLEIRKKDI